VAGAKASSPATMTSMPPSKSSASSSSPSSALVATARLLPETPRAAGQRLDAVGATLLVVTLGSLTIALTQLPATGAGATTIALLAATAVLAAGFVAVERRHPDPLLRFSLLAHPGVRAGNAMLALSAGATVGALFFATLYLQRTLGYSPLAVGAGFAPVTLIGLVASPVAGRLVTRLGARPLLVAGSLLAAGGLLLLAGLPTAATLPASSPAWRWWPSATASRSRPSSPPRAVG
jgi:hypothetical protein